MSTHLARTLLVGATLAVAAPAAAQFPDAAGDFLSTYTAGPLNGDLDVLSIRFEFDNVSTFRFFSTQAGPIGTTPGAAYVWGINRGAGVANFASLGLPDIRFDAVVALIPGGTSLFIDLLSGASPVPLAPGAVHAAGNELEAFVPLSLLTPQGFAPQAYTANLWPRSAFVLEDRFISDFAPDATNIGVAVLPEPTTWALVGVGLLTLGGTARRRRT
jgi:hypothetical protein